MVSTEEWIYDLISELHDIMAFSHIPMRDHINLLLIPI